MRFIVKLAEDKYMEWSTIVDAPVTWIISRSRMLEHLLAHSSDENEERLARTDVNGTSALSSGSLEDLIETNRAGEHDAKLTLEEIIERYTE